MESHSGLHGKGAEIMAVKLRKIKPEDIKGFIHTGDAQISPDGSKIVFCKTCAKEKNKSEKNIWIADCQTGKVSQFTSGNKDSHPRWSPDGSKIAFLSSRADKQTQIYIISPNGGEARSCSKLVDGLVGDFKWSPDSKHIAFTFREVAKDLTQKATKERESDGLSTPPMIVEQMWYRCDGDSYFNKQRFYLYLLDTESRKHKLLYNKSSDDISDFSWHPSGKEILFSTNLSPEPMLEPWNTRFYALNIKTKKVTLLKGQTDCSLGKALWSPDGKKIAFAARMGKVSDWASQNEKLYVYDVKSAKTKCISDNEDYCMGSTVIGDTAEAVFGVNFVWLPDSKNLLVSLGWHGDKYIAKKKISGGKFELLTPAKTQFSLSNITNDGKKLATIRGNSTNPGDLCLGTISKKGLNIKLLAAFNKEFLAELHLSEPEETWVTAKDGHKTHLWVMKPIGFKANKTYPAVLEIHGGPHALYGNTFFHEFQLLAANGYVVFYSNPRGSKGYGEEHCHAIAGDWGNKDWMDIQAVISYMKKQKFVDNKKMAVMGGSYGGYMTNWTIGHTNEFAAAITDRCVSNMISMMGSSDFTTLPDTYWKGNIWDDTNKFWQQSPLKYLGHAKTPTLIIHSEGDYRCNIEQAEQVFTVLKLRKIPCRFVRYPKNTSHGMSRNGPYDLRIHRLNEIINWLKKYLV